MRSAAIFVFVGVVISVASATEPEPVHELVISADIPTVMIAPGRPGRITMRLPSLTYSLTLAADCDENWQANSVSISVADSGKFFDTEELQKVTALQFELRVPSNQIAPLRVEGFCIKNDAGAADRASLTISAVLSAQASLRCATEFEQSMRYVTKPLDVTLECDVTESADD